MNSLDDVFKELSEKLGITPFKDELNELKLIGEVYIIKRDDTGLYYRDKTSSFRVMVIPDRGVTYTIRARYLDVKRNLLNESQTQIGKALAQEFAVIEAEPSVESVSAQVRVYDLSEVVEFVKEHVLVH
ncbi:MAG TPA: hypothetical protein VJJ82_00360 [Candidatus Nanoarchaeia archaeon]|nr:hypothetical protein [Candidatus Nanoarchaeia archaeon]